MKYYIYTYITYATACTKHAINISIHKETQSFKHLQKMGTESKFTDLWFI
jgi:hypothetical protein